MTLFPPTKWQSNAMAVKLCNGSHVPLLLCAKHNSLSPNIILSLLVDFPFQISLWMSKAFKLTHGNHCESARDEALYNLFLNFIYGILYYGPQEKAFASDWIPRRLKGSIGGLEDFQEDIQPYILPHGALCLRVRSTHRDLTIVFGSVGKRIRGP